jgi:pyruvate/2-oxoglutarate dehydrogenase complex dihydrolipoamide dehydrogenase (E3) component
MAEAEKFDAIIIGSGQAGIPLAKALANKKWKTALVERYLVGGCCINYGCTPSKTMAASSELINLVNKSGEFGIHTPEIKINLKEIINRKREIVKSFRESGEKGIEETENLELIRGEAKFIDKKTIEITSGENKTRRIKARKIFINTGGKPFIPAIEGIDKVDYLDSTSIMELEEKPEHLVVLGGGYIGLEFGQMFRRFGSRVTIIQRGSQLLSREDEDVAEEVQKILSDEGIKILLNTKVNSVSKSDKRIKLNLSSDGKENIIACSHLLVAVGRIPNTKSLNPEAAGIKTDERGYIKVKSKLETNVKGIYALGDVKGGPAFTHISYDDFRIIRDNLFKKKNKTIKNRLVPYTVFIDPQLGRVGITEKEAKQKKINYKVAKMPMNYIARAIEVNQTKGFMKAIVDADSKKILGCAILGIEGGELASMIQIAMMGNLKYTALKEGIFTHPTLAESLNNLFSEVE